MKTIFKFIKKLFKIIVWFVLIVLLLAVILYLCAGKIVQHFAPDFISKVTQTETTLGEVDISLLSGRVGLNNLTIGNPAGFKDKNALQLGNITVNFDPKSIFTDKIMISNVDISGVNVSTELNAAGKTNINELLNNVNKFVGEDQPAQPQKTQAKAKAPAQQPKEDDNSKAVVIKDLTIKDSSVRAGIAGQMMEVPLPEIHQQNIGEKKEQTWSEVLVGILNTINAESTKAVVKATKEALEKSLQTGKDAAKSFADTLKSLF